MRFRPQAGKSRGAGATEREDSLENRLMMERRQLTLSQWF